MADSQTIPEGSNPVGSPILKQNTSRPVLQSSGGEGIIPPPNEGEVQRMPKGKIRGGQVWPPPLEELPFAEEPPLSSPKRNTFYSMALRVVVPLSLTLTLLYPVSNICKGIVHEKERRLKESMKMMGLPEWLHWSAWLAKSLTFLAMLAPILALSYGPFFRNTRLTLLIAFLMSYIFSSITFAFLVASFCSKSTSSTSACTLLLFLPYVGYTILQKNYADLSMLTKMGCSLVHSLAMGFGVQVLTEFGEPGIQWGTIGRGPTHNDHFSMLHVIGMLILDGWLYLFLAVYLEAVFPGEFGVPLPFYFPLMPSYWFGSESSSGKVHPEDSSHEDDTGFFEMEPEGLNAGIQIMGLKKVFGAKVAVDGLTLNFYENQVTALLGHNGAGKTTTMSMLTGLCPPSSGTALVNGFDIRKDMKSVHGSLGLCPQHDVLFDEMTVEEHLRFFCSVKGYALPIQPEIDRMLVALNLEDKRDADSQTLSGGMKRKLSVGIALVGGSKVVLLDEPTAGLDPGARRSIWDLVSSEKQGRTIVLSTHFMDEAELLGDRIAILAYGKAVCCGSPSFLKQKYGGGYHLIMTKEPNCKVNVITELLQKYIPEVVLDQNVGSELSYSLPDKKVSIFPQMFEELEKRKSELGVSGYGCSITKMEEVFMRVGEQMEAEVRSKQLAQTAKSTLTGDSKSKVPSSREANVPNSQSNVTSHVMLSGEPSQSNVHIPSNQEVKVKMEDFSPTGNTRKNTGLVLQTQQLRAMLAKKWIYIERNKFTYIFLGALPVVSFTGILYSLKSSGSASGVPDPTYGPQIAFIMVFTMSFFAASFILFPIKEREVSSKHLQLVSGLPFLTFWLGHYLFDMGYYLVICILLTIGPIAISWTTIKSWHSISTFFLLLILYGWAVIPMTYLFSFRYTYASTGYSKTAFLYFMVGLAGSGMPRGDKLPWSVILIRFTFRFFPNFHLEQGIQKIARASADINSLAWGDIDATPMIVNPERPPMLGIGQHLFYLLITGIICIGLVLLIESKFCSSRPIQKIGNDISCDPTMMEDSDVTAENERIRNGNLNELCMSETMVVKNLTKFYEQFLAVDNVCLGVQHGECFGLLGVNGAGKTTTFKMLTGDISISSGDAYIGGMSVESRIKEVQKVIGYCPQFDALIPQLTGRETITLFARLRGIPEGEINELVETLAGDLLLLEHVEKPCGTYSGGNKRKLSTAIALIGSPSMVFLDEPTAGMDPVARRYLWNTIIKVREAGSAVVLTSHSMEECEALCTRLAIMVNGKFRCLGSPQHLKNKFGDGYTLIAQMQPSRLEQPPRTRNQKRTSLETGRRRQSLNAPPKPWEEYLQPLRNFIEKNFSDCQLKDVHPCYVHYHIPMGGISWGEMFKKMEEAKGIFQLAAYSIGQTSLEQIFLGFSKGQHNADD